MEGFFALWNVLIKEVFHTKKRSALKENYFAVRSVTYKTMNILLKEALFIKQRRLSVEEPFTLWNVLIKEVFHTKKRSALKEEYFIQRSVVYKMIIISI